MQTDSDRMNIPYDPIADLKAYDYKMALAIKSHQGSPHAYTGLPENQYLATVVRSQQMNLKSVNFSSIDSLLRDAPLPVSSTGSHRYISDILPANSIYLGKADSNYVGGASSGSGYSTEPTLETSLDYSPRPPKYSLH